MPVSSSHPRNKEEIDVTTYRLVVRRNALWEIQWSLLLSWGGVSPTSPSRINDQYVGVGVDDDDEDEDDEDEAVNSGDDNDVTSCHLTWPPV